MLEGGEVFNPGVVPGKDLGSWTEIVGEVLPHASSTSPQVVDVFMEGHIVGWLVVWWRDQGKGNNNVEKVT